LSVLIFVRSLGYFVTLVNTYYLVVAIILFSRHVMFVHIFLLLTKQNCIISFRVYYVYKLNIVLLQVSVTP